MGDDRAGTMGQWHGYLQSFEIMKKVAAIITSYNMPERTSALVEYMEAHCPEAEIIVVDNGSDDGLHPSRPAVSLLENVQTTNGWLMGMHYADTLEHRYHGSFFAYWVMITSAEFTAESHDPLAPMVAFMEGHYGAVGIHPALTDDSTTSWEHLKAAGTGFRKTWMIDNIAALWRADWFNSIGRFDPRFIYAWGPDLETSWRARKNHSLWICDDVKIKKVTDIGYTMNRMGMSSDARKYLARTNMDEVMQEKWGSNWRSFMYGENDGQHG
jgi:cellulose synthase/poly-beta-1,6-N-acetylglucosamine synthase-like glycosyltransferase